jgi:hypothetical protein
VLVSAHVVPSSVDLKTPSNANAYTVVGGVAPTASAITG